MRSNVRRLFVLMCLCLPGLASAADYAGWGFRLGAADDPDQVIGGLHFVLDDVARGWRMVPNFEIGVGDDHQVLALTLPFHYRFRSVDADFTPYAGGGVTTSFIDHDHPRFARHDDTDFELALRGIGGLEWHLSSADFFVQLDLIAGDPHDLQLMIGWTFRD